MIYAIKIFLIYIYHTWKKSASWRQLVAVVMGLKTMQSGKKRLKIVKNQPTIKGKIHLISKENHFEIFSRYGKYVHMGICGCVFVCLYKFPEIFYIIRFYILYIEYMNIIWIWDIGRLERRLVGRGYLGS